MRGIGARKQSRARNRLPDGPPTTPPNEEQLRGEEGAQALVDLARRNSGHSQGSNGSPDEPVHRRGVGEASSTDGGASNSAAMSAPMPVVGRYSQVEKTHATQFDFEAHVDWKVCW